MDYITATLHRILFYRAHAIENDEPDLNVAAQKCQKAQKEIIAQSFERAEIIAKFMVFIFIFLV